MDPISFVLGIVLAGLAIFFGRYFRRKGENLANIEDTRALTLLTERAKNLATKEDIGEITRQVEGVKDELARRSFEHQTRFAWRHQKRVETVAEVYAALIEAEAALELVTGLDGWLFAAEGAKERQLDEAVQAVNRFAASFDTKALFLPPDVLLVLVDIRKQMHKVLNDSRLVIARARGVGKTQRPEQTIELARTAYDIVRDALPALRASLEGAFRREFGEDGEPPARVETRGAVAEQPLEPVPALPAPSPDDKVPA